MCSKVQTASLMSSGTFIRVSRYWQHLMFITIPGLFDYKTGDEYVKGFIGYNGLEDG